MSVTITSFDVTREAFQPYFIEGAWAPESNRGYTYRWLGGETNRCRIAFPPAAAEGHQLVMTAMPQVNDDVRADIAFAGDTVGIIEFGQREFNRYIIDVA